jgi:hypothetical protein
LDFKLLFITCPFLPFFISPPLKKVLRFVRMVHWAHAVQAKIGPDLGVSCYTAWAVRGPKAL